MAYTSKLSTDDLRSIESNIIDRVRARTAQVLQVSPDQIAVRTLMPKEDLGYADDVWQVSLTTPGAYNAIVNLTMPQNKVIYVYGIKIPSTTYDPQISFIRLWKGNELIDIIDTERVYDGKEYKEIVLKQPIELNPNDTFKVEVYLASGVSASSSSPVTKSVIILGYVGEKLGTTITSPLTQ